MGDSNEMYYLISELLGQRTVIPVSVVAKLSESLRVSKETMHKFHTEKLNLEKEINRGRG
jgi:hypothetical protein